jgi:hypothetical protein
MTIKLFDIPPEGDEPKVEPLAEEKRKPQGQVLIPNIVRGKESLTVTQFLKLMGLKPDQWGGFMSETRRKYPNQRRSFSVWRTRYEAFSKRKI